MCRKSILPASDNKVNLKDDNKEHHGGVYAAGRSHVSISETRPSTLAHLCTGTGREAMKRLP